MGPKYLYYTLILSWYPDMDLLNHKVLVKKNLKETLVQNTKYYGLVANS